MKRIIFLFSLGFILTTLGCGPNGTGSDDDGPMAVNFDRRAMLKEWADEVITPAYAGFDNQLEELEISWGNYQSTPDLVTFETLKSRYFQAYLGWQRLSPFVFGKAEEIRLRSQVNTYPSDLVLIEENIVSPEAVNLALPSQAIAQGLPALDYLFFGPKAGQLASNENYQAYVSLLIDRMQALTAEAEAGWLADADAFVQNDGNSATASIDRMVNDYIFHYEKFLRAGKVGIPAGVFSDDPLADRAESLFAGTSKSLMLASLEASRQFFAERGLADYLDALNVQRDGALLSTTINDRFALIKAETENVGEDFAEQVESDNAKMLALYDEMQQLVILLKVDMLQALSINVDYVDADGD